MATKESIETSSFFVFIKANMNATTKYNIYPTKPHLKLKKVSNNDIINPIQKKGREPISDFFL